MQPTPQDNHLMSKHRILSFKPQLRLEWRGQDGQNETEQPDHSASLGDSITSSTRVRFSVHTGIDGAAVFNVRSGAAKLARQIQQTVDWAACIDSCRAAGVTKIIELGPGSALAHLVHEAMPYADVHSLSEFHSLAGFVQWATN